MAIVRKMIYENEPLTEQQIKQIEAADKKPIVFDEDCPELTDQQLKEIAAMAAQQRAERRKIKKAGRCRASDGCILSGEKK